MNFAHNSLKPTSKSQNEDFCFEIETAQGHFFAVLDFTPHDYSNLNATLEGKLQTVVGSFASLSNFSADLFLGFLAKEINNFLHELGEQSSGPEILCSGALCLVGGNRLSYLLCGNVAIDITGSRVLSLSGEPQAAAPPTDDLETTGSENIVNKGLDQLGADKLDAPLTGRVQAVTLLDDDVVLIMTHGLEAGLDRRRMPRELVEPGFSDPKSICEALIEASASSRDDRTVVVIAGPYENAVDPMLSDIIKAIAVLEARVNTLAESAEFSEGATRASKFESGDNAQKEQTVAQELQAFKVEVAANAARFDLGAFEGQLKGLGDALVGKADSAELLALKHDVLRLNKAASPNASAVSDETKEFTAPSSRKLSLAWVLPLVMIAAIGAAFIGAWLQSRGLKKTPEVWTVQTNASNLVIRRLDGNTLEAERTVSLNLAEPLKSTGELTFSSFAEVGQYVDSLTNSSSESADHPNSTNQPLVNGSPKAVTEVTVKPKPLQKVAARPQVTPETIKKSDGTRSKEAKKSRSPLRPSGTIEITVGPGDSLKRFAKRYNATPDKLRELNPKITNWGQIRTGQKLVVPSPRG